MISTKLCRLTQPWCISQVNYCSLYVYLQPWFDFYSFCLRIIVFSALHETACISFILQTFHEKVSKYKIVCFVLFILLSISYYYYFLLSFYHSFFIYFLAHLAKGNVSFWRLSSVNFSHFNLLHWNPLAKWMKLGRKHLWKVLYK